jgi:hypothetical protein
VAVLFPPIVFTGEGPEEPGGGGSGVTLDTLTFNNTSGSVSAANTPTEIFGLVFEQGDVPAGTYPALETSTGTPIPASFWDQTYWPDGSWKRCAGHAIPPFSVPGNSSVTANVKNGGSQPALNSRSLSDVNASSGRDLKVELTGFENLVGTWTSALNTGISDNDRVYLEVDRGTLKGWRIEQEFRDASSNHAHLTARHYVFAVNDVNNGLHGIYWLPQVMQPNYNTASPLRRAFDMTVRNGASAPLNDYQNVKTFTYTGTPNRVNCPAHGFLNGELVRFTTTGTLPTGLTTSMVAAAKVIDANTLQFHSNSTETDTTNTAALITFSTAGSGTHTVRRVIGVDQYGSFYGAQTDGKSQFIAGTGSRTTVRVMQSRAYMLQTGLFMPYDTSVVPSADTVISYTPNTQGNLRRDTGASGPHPQIAVQPEWTTRHFLLRTTNDDQIVRVNGLVTGHLAVWIRDQTTRQPPVFNNKSYSGLPATNNSIRYAHPTYGPNSGVNNPPSAYLFYSGFGSDHLCHGPSYAYLTLGAPWFRDIIQQYAIMPTLSRGTGERQKTIGGTTYWAHMYLDPYQARSDMWGNREMGVAAALLPANSNDGSAVYTYVRDLATDSANMFIAHRNSQSAGYRDGGHYEVGDAGDGRGSPWMSAGFGGMSSALVDGMMGGVEPFRTIGQHWANFYTSLRANGGLYHVNAYRYAARNESDLPYSTNGDLTFGGYNCSTDAGTNRITITKSIGPAIANGDRLSFDQPGALPGGVTRYRSYYLVNVSGNTAQLSNTLGGSPITISSNVTSYCFYRHSSGSFIGQGIAPGDNYGGGYSGVHFCSTAMLAARGYAGMAACFDDMLTMLNNGSGPNLATYVKHAVKKTYS